jgi:hypothetical protein
MRKGRLSWFHLHLLLARAVLQTPDALRTCIDPSAVFRLAAEIFG